MATSDVSTLRRSTVAAVTLTSAALLMTELALTRIFSVTMYYHFAFLAISIALFGLSASGVYVFVARRWLLAREPSGLLAGHALAFAAVTVLALALLVRIRVGLNYSPQNLRLMLAIYALAALPFFAGGAVVSLALTRFAAAVNVVYAADLAGAAAGCLLLIPLLNSVGAPGAMLVASLTAALAAVLFQAPGRRARGGSGCRPARRHPRRGATLERGAVRCPGYEGTRGRSRPLQPLELVLARRGVRPWARRLVA